MLRMGKRLGISSKLPESVVESLESHIRVLFLGMGWGLGFGKLDMTTKKQKVFCLYMLVWLHQSNHGTVLQSYGGGLRVCGTARSMLNITT